MARMHTRKRGKSKSRRIYSQVEKISAQFQSAGIEFSSTIKNRVNQKQINEILDYVKGLVSSDPIVVSKALLTPFSGLTLQEAVNHGAELAKGDLKEELTIWSVAMEIIAQYERAFGIV